MTDRRKAGGSKSAVESNHARLAPAGAALKLRSVLVPTDFSDESRKALIYAVAFARQFGAKLTLLHVVEPVATPDFAEAFPLALDSEQTHLECKRRLERLVHEIGVESGLIENSLVRQGRAHHEICAAAEALKSDLIIISTHGYTGLKHAFMGSNSERVVRHAPCPVLVVRREEHDFLETAVKP